MVRLLSAAVASRAVIGLPAALKGLSCLAWMLTSASSSTWSTISLLCNSSISSGRAFMTTKPRSELRSSTSAPVLERVDTVEDVTATSGLRDTMTRGSPSVRSSSSCRSGPSLSVRPIYYEYGESLLLSLPCLDVDVLYGGVRLLPNSRRCVEECGGDESLLPRYLVSDGALQAERHAERVLRRRE